MADIAAEIDLCRHLSFSLPVRYSGINYFKPTLKFRTVGYMPELRGWLRPGNDGFFAGAHFGMSWYNFAFDGASRYQDHAGDTPAIGGGLSIGYRLPVSKNGRWKMEFALGAGVYRLNYDIFDNVPDGRLLSSVQKTWAGIDSAAISFAYMFNLGKKGGAR